jgi:uncharacterized protein (TIGR00251 family)
VADPWYRWDGPDLILHLHIQPRAARDEIAGPHGDALKVRLAAPPVGGRANEQLRVYLAGLCGVAKSQVTLFAGETGRAKRVRIAAPRRLPPFVTVP